MSIWAAILAGGSGTRFWPLSTPERPKQFLPLTGDRPLLAQAVARLRGLVPPERVLIIPRVPTCSGPSSRDSFISGFHSGQELTSDHTRQTRSGAADVSSEASRKVIDQPSHSLWMDAAPVTRGEGASLTGERERQSE